MMKKMFVLFCLGALLLTFATVAEESAGKSTPRVVAAAKAEDFIGSTCVVTGKVAEVYATDKLVRLNFDNRFPKQTFTAVIFAPKTNLFTGLDKLQGKDVEVTGKITEYREKAQIVLTGTNQLKVIESR